MNPTHSLLRSSAHNVPTQSDPGSWVRDFIEVIFNRGDLSQLETFIHPEYRYSSPTDEIVGPEALRAFITALRMAFPDMHVRVNEQIREDRKVCTRVELTGTQLGEFDGIPATGRPIKIDGVIISEMADGRIVREWELLDQYAMLQQLGLLPEENES